VAHPVARGWSPLSRPVHELCRGRQAPSSLMHPRPHVSRGLRRRASR
jgi:hypothetical protein